MQIAPEVCLLATRAFCSGPTNYSANKKIPG